MGAFYSRAAYRVAEAETPVHAPSKANFFDLRVEETMILVGIAAVIVYCVTFYALFYYGTYPLWYPLKLVFGLSWDVAVGLYGLKLSNLI